MKEESGQLLPSKVDSVVANLARNEPSPKTISSAFSENCVHCDKERKQSLSQSSLSSSKYRESSSFFFKPKSVYALQSIIHHQDATNNGEGCKLETSVQSNSKLTPRSNTHIRPGSGTESRKPTFYFVGMEHLVAGVSGGVASTLILHPLDLVKIRFAVADGLSSRPQYNGLFHAFKSILKDEGVKGLYR